MVIYGDAGLSKSFRVKKVCNGINTIKCHVSPLGLYTKFHQHRDDAILMDDLDEIYNDKICVKLLKSATESEDKRLVSWTSTIGSLRYTNEDDDRVPCEFDMTGPILLISNDWSRHTANLQALEDRARLIHFCPNPTEIHREVAKWFKDQEILDFIESFLPYLQHLSMRVYLNALDAKKAISSGLDWRQDVLQELNIDPATVAIVQLLRDETLTQNQRAEKFTALTGHDRATYYRRLKGMRVPEKDATLRLVAKSHEIGNGLVVTGQTDTNHLPNVAAVVELVEPACENSIATSAKTEAMKLATASIIHPAQYLMNGKPVFEVDATTVINTDSGFGHKLLCDYLTLTTGSACAYLCAYCFVEDLMSKCAHVQACGLPHEQMVIRRRDALKILRKELTDRYGNPKYNDPSDKRVIYTSPLVDIAANPVLVAETIEACKIILELTNWQIRLLSKSNLIVDVAKGLPESQRQRLIFGVSTGTLDDKLARSFEIGTPLVSKRLEALHWLQDNGFRTFAMICPSLPQRDYRGFAQDMANAIRWDRCEHVWAEVLNARGESFDRTFNALMGAGFEWEAQALKTVSTNKEAWEQYARDTFEAHASIYPPGKLRFLQYVVNSTRAWWTDRQDQGAILL